MCTDLSLQHRFRKAKKLAVHCCCDSGPVKKWIGAHCERKTETKSNARNVMNRSRRLRLQRAAGNAKMQRGYAKNAFVGMSKRSSRGNAWRAQRGKKRTHSWQNMQSHKRHFIGFAKHAKQHKCVLSAKRARTNVNSRRQHGNEHAMAVECVLIVRVKLGDGGDAVCAG